MTSFVRPLLRFARAACLALIATAAIASAPYIAGPSMLESSDSAAFTGGGFVPSATVQVRVTDPGGHVTVSVAVANGEGQVSFTVSPRGAGQHSVVVVDLAGNTLASATFLCPR